MKLVYAPEGAEPKDWEYPPDLWPIAESIEAEKVSGLLMPELTRQAEAGGATAKRALLYVLLRREVPNLRLADVQCRAGDISIVYEDTEIDGIIAGMTQAEADGTLSPGQRDALDRLRASRPAPEASPDVEPVEDDAADPTQPPSEPEPPKPSEPDPSGNGSAEPS